MDRKGYFIILPEGHTKEVFLKYVDFLVGHTGKLPPSHYSSNTQYLVTYCDADYIVWGVFHLEKHRKDPNFIELHLYVENV